MKGSAAGVDPGAGHSADVFPRATMLTGCSGSDGEGSSMVFRARTRVSLGDVSCYDSDGRSTVI